MSQPGLVGLTENQIVRTDESSSVEPHRPCHEYFGWEGRFSKLTSVISFLQYMLVRDTQDLPCSSLWANLATLA